MNLISRNKQNPYGCTDGVLTVHALSPTITGLCRQQFQHHAHHVYLIELCIFWFYGTRIMSEIITIEITAPLSEWAWFQLHMKWLLTRNYYLFTQTYSFSYFLVHSLYISLTDARFRQIHNGSIQVFVLFIIVTLRNIN